MIIYLIYCQNNRNLLVFLGVVFEMEVDRSRSHSLGVRVCVSGTLFIFPLLERVHVACRH